MMGQIVVVGAGVVALGTAMLLTGDGHQVIVLERDPEGPPADPVEAWELPTVAACRSACCMP